MPSVVEHLGSVLAFLLFVAAPVPLGSWVVALREDVTKQRLSVPQVLLLLLSVWCVVQALVAHALGVLHLLRFPGALLTELLVCGAGALTLSRRRMASPWIDRTRRIAEADALETLALLTLTFMGLTLLWWSAAMPVVNYDAWAFHMPHMAEWLQSGTFTRMAQGAERARNSYPYGWEALCTLFLTPFGEDMLVTFPNLVAWALLGLATYLLARLWRARRIHALACSACLLAIHYIADPVNTMHVDMPFAALFTTSAYYGAIHARGGDRVALGLSAATIGLACATRVTGPVYALLLATWVLFVRASARREQLPNDATRTPVLVGFAAAILLGAFWYTKNLLELGHVLGPGMPVTGPGTVKGSWSYFAARTLAFTFNPLQASSWKAVMDRAFHELDAPFLAIVAMAALWPVARLWRRPAHRDRSAVALALLLVGTGVVFWFTPLSAISTIQMRLGLPFLAVLAVAAAVGATRSRLHATIPVAFALVSATRTFSGSRVLFVLMLLAVVWGVWRAREATARLSRGRACAAAVGVAVLVIVTATFLARERRERERHVMYGSFYAYLEQHVGPNEPVAYLLSNRSYLFYGRRLARSVVYAPLAAEQRVEDWADHLHQQHISIVAVGPWNGDDAKARATLDRLTAPGGPLVAISGSGAPGDISLFKLEHDEAAVASPHLGG